MIQNRKKSTLQRAQQGGAGRQILRSPPGAPTAPTLTKFLKASYFWDKTGVQYFLLYKGDSLQIRAHLLSPKEDYPQIKYNFQYK